MEYINVHEQLVKESSKASEIEEVEEVPDELNEGFIESDNEDEEYIL